MSPDSRCPPSLLYYTLECPPPPRQYARAMHPARTSSYWTQVGGSPPSHAGPCAMGATPSSAAQHASPTPYPTTHIRPLATMLSTPRIACGCGAVGRGGHPDTHTHRTVALRSHAPQLQPTPRRHARSTCLLRGMSRHHEWQQHRVVSNGVSHRTAGHRHRHRCRCRYQSVNLDGGSIEALQRRGASPCADFASPPRGLVQGRAWPRGACNDLGWCMQ